MQPASRRSGLNLRLRPPRAPATYTLIGLLFAAFVLQGIFSPRGEWTNGFISDYLCLNGPNIRDGKLWVLLTSTFLHESVFHFFFNALGIGFMGTAIEREYGGRRMWSVFLFGALAGSVLSALLWSIPAYALEHPVSTIGASGGAMALLAYYLAGYLKEEMTILIFYVIPVQVQGRDILCVTGGLTLLGLFGGEIPHATAWWHAVGFLDSNLSHTCHLGGLAFGFVWRRWQIRVPALRRPTLRILKPEFLKKSGPADRDRETEQRFPSAPSVSKDLRGEVDRILDKINQQGFGALTHDERATLEKARQTLNR